MQLNGLLDLVALGVNHLHGAGAQGGHVELAIGGVHVHVHCDVRFSLGVGELNLLDQGVRGSIEDANAARARYKDLATRGVDAYLTRVIDVAFCATPNNLIGRGIEDRYLVDTGLGHPYVSGCFVVGNTVGCNVPGADATGQNRRASGRE